MRRYLVTATVLLAFVAYAFVRYNVVKGVPWEHLPVYVVNKAVALLELGFLGVSASGVGGCGGAPPGSSDLRRWSGLAGLVFATLHVLMSLPILSPAYFPGLYRAGGWTFAAELAILAGSVGFVALLPQAWISLAPSPKLDAEAGRAALRRLGWAAVVLSASHCAAWGWDGWWAPDSWPGHLPPVTLIGFALAASALIRTAKR